MGWTFHIRSGQSKADFVKERVSSQNGVDGSKYNCLCHSVKGNTIYAVWEITKADGSKVRFIGVDLIAKQRGGGWGYKDISEAMGPNEIDCPLKYFDMVPDPGSYATEWRKKCIEKANQKKVASKEKKSIKVGDKIMLVSGCKPESVEVCQVTPKLIGISSDGMRYRIAPRHIEKVIHI